MNSCLFMRCGLHGSCSETLPCVSSQIRRPQQQKHISSCVVQLCHRFPCADEVEFYKALLLASEFPTFYEHFFIIRLNSSSSGSKKKILCNLLALPSLGFSMSHLGFSLRFDALDTCFHMSGHTLSGLEVVCFLVSLSPDHENPSGGFSFNTMNLVKPVHASDNSSNLQDVSLTSHLTLCR